MSQQPVAAVSVVRLFSVVLLCSVTLTAAGCGQHDLPSSADAPDEVETEKQGLDTGMVHAYTQDYLVCASGATVDSAGSPCIKTIAVASLANAPAGEYRVTTNVQWRTPTATTYSHATIKCFLNGNAIANLPYGQLTQSRNVLTAETTAQRLIKPRLVTSIPTAGTLECRLMVRGEKGIPDGNRYGVSSASYIRIMGPFRVGTNNLRLAGNQVLRKATYDLVQSSAVSIGANTGWISVYGDASATTCNSTSGDLNNGCATADNTHSYSTVRTQLFVYQYPYTTSFCASKAFPAETWTITDEMHHGMLYAASGTFTPDPACDPNIKVKLQVIHTGGSPVLLSENSTILNYVHE